MAGFQFQIGTSESESKAGSLIGRIVLFLFATPFAAFGMFAFWQAIQRFRAEDTKGAMFLSLFGIMFSAVGLGLMFAAITAERRRKAAAEKWLAQTDGGKKIWLARSDWAAGKIKSSTSNQWKTYLVMGTVFSAIGCTVSFFALRDELPKHNYAVLLVLIFPVVGLSFFYAAIRALLARRRFGDCFFELAQMPAPLGGSLDGLIQTGARLNLENSLHLKFSCIRRTVTGSGKNRSTSEDILWQDEKVFRPDASLPMTADGGTGIPVHFNLPANQPESVLRGNPTISWRLEVKSKMAGPDFSALFEVPVFHVADTVPAPETEPDPTASLQMSAEEIRRDEHSRIQVTDGPNGREFYFPAARNLGMAFGLTFFLVIWSGVLWLMMVKHAPILFPIVFSLFEIFILWGCVSAWFKSSRVTVNGTGVTLQNRWLLFNRTRRFDASEIARFELKVGLTSGATAFHDLKLVTRAGEQDELAARKESYQQTSERPPMAFKIGDPSGITLASNIASRPEAEWLAREMTRALGRNN